MYVAKVITIDGVGHSHMHNEVTCAISPARCVAVSRYMNHCYISRTLRCKQSEMRLCPMKTAAFSFQVD
jgi:hypothetical protein